MRKPRRRRRPSPDIHPYISAGEPSPTRLRRLVSLVTGHPSTRVGIDADYLYATQALGRVVGASSRDGSGSVLQGSAVTAIPAGAPLNTEVAPQGPTS